MIEKLLTMKDVADRLSIGRTLVYKLVEEGQLKAKRIGSGRGTLGVRPSDLERFINQSDTKSVPTTSGGLFD